MSHNNKMVLRFFTLSLVLMFALSIGFGALASENYTPSVTPWNEIGDIDLEDDIERELEPEEKASPKPSPKPAAKKEAEPTFETEASEEDEITTPAATPVHEIAEVEIAEGTQEETIAQTSTTVVFSLIIIGLIIVAAVYISSMRSRKRNAA